MKLFHDFSFRRLLPFRANKKPLKGSTLFASVTPGLKPWVNEKMHFCGVVLNSTWLCTKTIESRAHQNQES
jgi:hypothetical protein